MIINNPFLNALQYFRQQCNLLNETVWIFCKHTHAFMNHPSKLSNCGMQVTIKCRALNTQFAAFPFQYFL